jgi:hypothetical protein
MAATSNDCAIQFRDTPFHHPAPPKTWFTVENVPQRLAYDPAYQSRFGLYVCECGRSFYRSLGGKHRLFNGTPQYYCSITDDNDPKLKYLFGPNENFSRFNRQIVQAIMLQVKEIEKNSTDEP